MNIWIFNPYEPLPHEGSVRLRYASLSEVLIAQGHAVTCPPSENYGVTCPPPKNYGVTWWSTDWSHGLKRQRSAPLEPSSSFQVRSASSLKETRNEERETKKQLATGELKTGKLKLKLKLIPVPAYQKNISLARVWSHWRYAKGIESRASAYAAEHGKPDVILFSVPPMEAGRVALKLGKQFGAKVVLDVMDAWPEALLLALPGAGKDFGEAQNSGNDRSIALQFLSAFGRLALWPYSRMMRRYCREADAVCAQSQAFADYARSFGATGKIPVFHLAAHQPANIPERRTAQPDTDKAQLPLRLLYLGSMGRVYDLHTLVEAVISLANEGASIHLDMIGDGEQRQELESRVTDAGQSGAIHFHGYVQGDALVVLLEQADVGVIPMHPESGVAIPYKAPHYLSHGLYVVSSLPGELLQKLEQFECGAHYQAGDAKDLAEKIQKLAADSDRLNKGRANAYQLFQEEFESDQVHAAMVDWLTNEILT